MTDTLRDKLIQKGWVTPFNADTLVRLIEKHYADEPAVPEGREPAAVTGQPNWRGLCAELVDAWLKGDDIVSAMNRARAVLARWGNLKGSLTSSPPADGEVAECAAELLQQQALVPVSVSERLPGPEDCDAEGRCWWWDGEWGLIEQRFTDYIVTHWLPAHALPLPEVNND